MVGNPRQITLGQAADLLTGFPFKSADFSNSADGIRLLRGDNIVQGRTRWAGVKRWQKNALTEHAQYILRPGDVVLAMDRPWIEAGLKHATLTDDDCPSLLVQRVARLRARPGVDQRFLGYVIRSAEFTNYVVSIQTGTVVPHISSSQIKAYKFLLPSPSQQKATVNLLGALDSKIELNQRMVETLEAIARTMFKSWFVNFEPLHAKANNRSSGLVKNIIDLFPDRIGDDGIPDGWTYAPLQQLIENRISRIQPSPTTALLPYVPIDSIRQKALISIDEKHGNEAQSSLVQFKQDDILFGAMRPYFHKVCLAPFDGTTRTTVFVLRPKMKTDLAYSLLLMSEETTIDFATNNASGSTIPYAVWDGTLADMKFALPPESIRKRFGDLVMPLLRRAENLSFESKKLSALRDTLLPKLISGELLGKGVEKRIAAA